MELSEDIQECPYCGLCYTDFEFHIRIHDDCKMLEEQRKALGRKRENMLGLEDALRLVDSHLQPSVDEEEDDGGNGLHGEPGNFETGSDSGFIVPKIELGIRKLSSLKNMVSSKPISKTGQRQSVFLLKFGTTCNPSKSS